ncbi:MAG: tRNA (guanosine(37)-N1)-methyltransferase TrmD [Candidatus Altimarinota bacterium]
MEIHILSLFPESIRPYLESSIMKRAQEKGLFQYKLHNLTDWTVRNTRRVDDRPYGGFPGTVLTIEPLTHALRDLESMYGKMRFILPSPRGKVLKQEDIENNVQESTTPFCIICPHYEGVDERIFQLFPIETFSLGEYIISSGELASLVWIDSVVRLIPGVLSTDSIKEESFSPFLERQKEYPQYSRPENFEGLKVPGVLLSGNMKEIEKWKRENRE